MPPSGGPIKVKPKKVRKVRVKPPAGDVASSGGDYGKKRAAPQVKKELKTIRRHQAEVKDTKGASDLDRAKKYRSSKSFRITLADAAIRGGRGDDAMKILVRGKGTDKIERHGSGARGLALVDHLLSGKTTAGVVKGLKVQLAAPFIWATRLRRAPST
jgi:hypothetical protein